MIPRSRVALALLIALPLLLLVPLWQTARRRPRLQGIMSAPPMALALSGDGSVVVAQRSNGTFCSWPRSGKHFDLQDDRFGSSTNISIAASVPAELRFSPDNNTILGANVFTKGTNTSLYAWDAQTGKIKWSAVSDLKDDLCRYWTSPDGTRAAQRAYDVVKVFDISTAGAPQSSKKSKFARIFPLLSRFSPRSTKPGIAGGSSLPQILALSPDNKTLVVVNTAAQLEFWDVAKGERLFETSPPFAPGSGSAIMPAPPGIAPGVRPVSIFGNELRLQYSPDGRFVALFDGTMLWLLDVAARKWLQRTVESTSGEAFLTWMPDSRSIWTGSGSIQQWSVPGLVSQREIPVGGPVAISGDGKVLATRALNNSGIPAGVWVWDIG